MIRDGRCCRFHGQLHFSVACRTPTALRIGLALKLPTNWPGDMAQHSQEGKKMERKRQRSRLLWVLFRVIGWCFFFLFFFPLVSGGVLGVAVGFRRLFNQRYGWQIKGLETTGGLSAEGFGAATNLSSGARWMGAARSVHFHGKSRKCVRKACAARQSAKCCES